MENSLKVFEYNNNKVRTVEEDGEIRNFILNLKTVIVIRYREENIRG